MARERSDAEEYLARIYGPHEGGRIPGGCDSCDAYQIPRQFSRGVWMLTVHHDDWCSELKRIEKGGQS